MKIAYFIRASPIPLPEEISLLPAWDYQGHVLLGKRFSERNVSLNDIIPTVGFAWKMSRVALAEQWRNRETRMHLCRTRTKGEIKRKEKKRVRASGAENTSRIARSYTLFKEPGARSAMFDIYRLRFFVRDFIASDRDERHSFTLFLSWPHFRRFRELAIQYLFLASSHSLSFSLFLSCSQSSFAQ